MPPGLIYTLVAIVALAAGVALVKLLDWYTRRGAKQEAEGILERAQQDAVAKVREADLDRKSVV